MQVYLNTTRQLVQQRKYKEALERFVWFHDHALEYDQGMGGVRLSFALSDWRDLGDVYPPAKQALVDTRNRKAQQLREGKGYAALFHDVAGLNGTLDENAATVRLFRELDKSHPELAGRCWHFAKDEVFKQKQYDLAKKYVKDLLNEFERVKAGYDMNVGLYSDPRIGRPEFKQWNEKHFIEECLDLIELANVKGDKKAAEEIRKRAESVIGRLIDPVGSKKG